MRPIKLLLLGLACGCALLACGANDDDSTTGGPEHSCIAGNSVACAGPNGCTGYQICRADGSAFDSCFCNGSATGLGGAMDATGGSGYGGNGLQGLGGVSAKSTREATGFATGGTALVASSDPVGAAGNARSCAPAEMTGRTYPPYKPARRLLGTCTQADVRDYYANCYVNGICTDFGPNGSKSSCGECLTPTGIDADAYGPLIRLGTATNPLDETNMAGCIELMGEAECAKKMMTSALCEYLSCATNCPSTDSASYQALTNCMLDARSSSCSAPEREAVCISNSAHVAACSAPGFEAQFIAIAKVFCVSIS